MNQVMKEEKGSVVVAAGRSSNGFIASFSHKFTNLNLKMAFLKPELALSSPDFYFDGIFWAFKLYLKEDPKSDIGLFLQSYCDSDPITFQKRKLEIAVKLTLYVVTTDSKLNNIRHDSELEYVTIDSTSRNGNEVGGFFIDKKKLLQHPFIFIPDDVLTIGCKLNWAFKSQNVETLPSPTIPFPFKLNSFEQFFNNPKFNDLKISTGGQIFYTSKLLLGEASDVFKQMILDVPSESPTDTIRAEDINADAFKGVLRYICCKVLPDLQLEVDAEDWLKITQKFKLHALQNVLQKGFVLQLKPSNAIICLKVADKYSVADLRKKCKQYIQGNWKEVVANHGLTKFTSCPTIEELQKSLELLAEVTESLSSPSKRSRLN